MQQPPIPNDEEAQRPAAAGSKLLTKTSAISKLKQQTRRILDANQGRETPMIKKQKKMADKKLQMLISLLQKEKDNRSLHDLRALTPWLLSPGKYIVEFMKKQNVKEKDIFKMCNGLTYQQLHEGEFACHYGEKDLASRKAMILFDGVVSVQVPMDPEVMLGFVEEILAHMEKRSTNRRLIPGIRTDGAVTLKGEAAPDAKPSAPDGLLDPALLKGKLNKRATVAVNPIQEDGEGKPAGLGKGSNIFYSRAQFKVIEQRLLDQLTVINQVQNLYGIINKYKADQEQIEQLKMKKKEVAVIEEAKKNLKESKRAVQKALQILSVLDGDVESPFDQDNREAGNDQSWTQDPRAGGQYKGGQEGAAAQNRSLESALAMPIDTMQSHQLEQFELDGLPVKDVTFVQRDSTHSKLEAASKSHSFAESQAAAKEGNGAPSATKQANEDNDGVVIQEEDRFLPSRSEVWSKLSKAANRTFIRVNRKLIKNPNWLASQECDLNELEKNILCAFNIDVRRTAVEPQDITIEFNMVKYTCKNGIFLKEISRIEPDKETGVNPCFGEYSLISSREKQVSIRCEADQCHFIVLDRKAFAEVLADMAQKRLQHIIKFVETIPCFSNQTKVNMEYFCKHMEKVYFKRNQTIYVKDQPVSHLYIVKKGQFELSKPLNKNLSSNTAKILELLGMEDIKNRSQNLIGRRLPELQKEAPQNLPQDLRLYQHNVGAIMGEQDLIKEISYVQEEGKLPPPSTPRYAGTLKCTSQRAKVYVIHKDHFLALKASTDSHLLLLNQGLLKNKRYWGEDLREKPQKEKKVKNETDDEKERVVMPRIHEAAAQAGNGRQQPLQYLSEQTGSQINDSLFESQIGDRSLQMPLIRVEKNANQPGARYEATSSEQVAVQEGVDVGSQESQIRSKNDTNERWRTDGETGFSTDRSMRTGQIQNQDISMETSSRPMVDASQHGMETSIERQAIVGNTGSRAAKMRSVNVPYERNIVTASFNAGSRQAANYTILKPQKAQMLQLPAWTSGGCTISPRSGRGGLVNIKNQSLERRKLLGMASPANQSTYENPYFQTIQPLTSWASCGGEDQNQHLLPTGAKQHYVDWREMQSVFSGRHKQAQMDDLNRTTYDRFRQVLDLGRKNNPSMEACAPRRSVAFSEGIFQRRHLPKVEARVAFQDSQAAATPSAGQRQNRRLDLARDQDILMEEMYRFKRQATSPQGGVTQPRQSPRLR